MSSINEVLGLTDTVTDVLVIDSDLRTIKIPKTITNIGVESDDEVLSLPFRMPRYYHGIDLSAFRININYLNSKKVGDVHEIKEPSILDESIEFEWLIGRHATQYKGMVEFVVCLKEVIAGEVVREFNTTIAELPVLEGLETGGAVVAEHSDILEQWREELLNSSGTITGHIEDVARGEIAKIEQAVTTYVAEHHEELRGPAGDPGEKGDTGHGFKVLDYYSSESALKAAITNPSPGDAYGVGTSSPYDIWMYGETSGWVNTGPLQGAKGDPGDTPEKGEDYWTEADKTEIINAVLNELPRAENISV